MTNDQLLADVTQELRYDPKVDASTIVVSVADGTVTLRGSVGSFPQKREAMKAAQRVHGVTSVDNQLDVHLMAGGIREDDELRADILHALMLDSLVPSTVDVLADMGFVTLTGTAQWGYQRDEAETVASAVRGVVALDDQIKLTGELPEAHDVKHSIEGAIKRNAKLDAEGITVDTDGNTVTLKGKVASWAERDDAVAAAWAAPGVHDVHDHLLVAY